MLALFFAYLDDENDKRLFEDIFFSYRKQMITVASSVVQNAEDAEDVVSSVFLKIATKYWDNVRDIKNDVDLRNYLLKATKNTALNYLKRNRRWVLSLDTSLEPDLICIANLADDTFVETVCNRVQYDQIVKAIRSLDGKYRDALYCHFVMEMTIPRTAKLLDQSVAATKKQVYRGKIQLLALLDKKGSD